MNDRTPAPRAATGLIRALIAGPQLRLRKTSGNEFVLAGSKTARPRKIKAATVTDLLACGLLETDGGTVYRTGAVARSWLIRRKTEEMTFKAQHGEIEIVVPPGGRGKPTVLINRNECPVSQLARRSDRSGKKLLQPFQVAAAERLRADFERGRLQPTITANWSATVSSRRRSGGGSRADLT